MFENAKSPNKRKSFNKTPEAASKAKMLTKSQSPNSPNKFVKSGTPKTPFQMKSATPLIQSEKKSNKKRNSMTPSLINGGSNETPSKKSKIEPFSGTANLFPQLKTDPEDESKTLNNKNAKQSPKKLKVANKITEESNTSSDDKSPEGKKSVGRIRNRKDKVAAMRLHAKDRLKKLISGVISGEKSAVDEVKKRVADLEKKEKQSHTSKRKLRMFRRALRDGGFGEVISSDTGAVKKDAQNDNVKKQKGKQMPQQNQAKKVNQNKKIAVNQKKPPLQPKIEFDDDSEEESDDDAEVGDNVILQKSKQIKIKEEESEEDDDNSPNLIENESEEVDDEDSSDEVDDEENSSDEVEGEENENSGTESDDEEEENESSDEEEDENDEMENMVSKVTTQKKPQPKAGKQIESTVSSLINDKSRYVVFVGNLPYDVTKEELLQHFSAKIGNVKDVRIPLDKQTNKCRGFAYVELLNQTSYEKALSLHHTQMKGRRINVQYTQGGKKKGTEKKQEIKAKNLKLTAMRQQGKLAGSIKPSQKRAARREKRKSVNKKD